MINKKVVGNNVDINQEVTFKRPHSKLTGGGAGGPAARGASSTTVGCWAAAGSCSCWRGVAYSWLGVGGGGGGTVGALKTSEGIRTGACTR